MNGGGLPHAPLEHACGIVVGEDNLQADGLGLHGVEVDGAFKEVLSLPQFKNYEAGIVVQAYLPDAWDFQSELLEFARKRVAEGGSPIKMRIVKGCNLDMENIVSDLRGWPNPVRPNKTEVDANYLHIIERGLKPENAKVLHIGMASHNLFTMPD